MGNRLNGGLGLSQCARAFLLNNCNGKRNPPIEFIGNNLKFIKCMTYNFTGGEYVS